MAKTRFKGDIIIEASGDNVNEFKTTAVLVKCVDGVTNASHGTTGVKVFELPPYSSMIDIVVFATSALTTGRIYAGYSASGVEYLSNQTVTLGNTSCRSLGAAGVANWIDSGSTKRDVYLRFTAAAGTVNVAFLFAPGINTPDRKLVG